MAACLLVPSAFAEPLAAAGETPVKVVLVIDDIGNSAADVAAVDLPGAVTLSVLPFTPHSRRLAEQAFLHGKEVMLHMPMQAKAGNRLGPGALTEEMTPTELQQMLVKALASVPHVVGVNNHMGSDLTESFPHMVWTMRLLRYYPLFFLDSRTSVNTCAEAVAVASGVPALRRHLFLDNLVDTAAISRQFDRLLILARQQGVAIGIGHPYPETLAVLQQRLPELEAQGIRLVPASALISEQRWLARQQSSLAPLAVPSPLAAGSDGITSLSSKAF